jgi:hypothetical protein
MIRHERVIWNRLELRQLQADVSRWCEVTYSGETGSLGMDVLRAVNS